MEAMEKLELTITILLVLLVAVCVYIAASWTLWRRSHRRGDGGIFGDSEYDSAIYRSFGKQVVQEDGAPKITITPVQPRLQPQEGTTSPMMTDDEDGPRSELQEDDLGRLYFSLQYDQHRSALLVRLIRGEDIPLEQDVSGTYVGVHLLPISLVSDVIEPGDTSINVTFQECYEFPLTQSELASQTLDFHICRYDKFSRRTVVGDVFLALAELGAQGIDITREVYLCRNIISSREAYHKRKRKRLVSAGDEQEGEHDFELRQGKKVSRSTRESGADPKELWKILRAAVRKGKYRVMGADPDTPVYQWDPMMPSESPRYEYKLPTSPHMPGGIFYFSGPGPPATGGVTESETDEEVVSQGKRSGSFLFPVKSDSGEDAAEAMYPDSQHSSSPNSPLQISPAPEEYYTLVPITPFTPASPLKHRTAKDPSVSWHVPETFSARDQDVVQTLADAYNDPKIVKSANLRQAAILAHKRQAHRTIPSATAAALEGVRTDEHRVTKRKTARRGSGTGNRAISPKRQKAKVSPSRTVTQSSGESSSKGKTKVWKGKVKPKASWKYRPSPKDMQRLRGSEQSGRDVSSSPELSNSPATETGLRFEAKDFIVPCVPPLKECTQSDPYIGPHRQEENTGETRQKRLSVSLTEVLAEEREERDES
ncbi:uncharacterized protein LOC5515774 isoform X1 [Nematostella vectensis]|uniref:uncharacterized protein LOC5515774 isoform X1 n=1 Tax=Nematostella vectensis TaxID=45351 RepID=UPI002076DA4E|nr:uncharacterized protein LOC5515774 isoform X1 [Nematostella vectensis]